MRGETRYILWLKPEDYPRFRELFDDVDDTYDEWLARMERRIPDFIEQGVNIERVLVGPDKMAAWCRETGRAVDADARALYPAILALHHGGEGKA